MMNFINKFTNRNYAHNPGAKLLGIALWKCYCALFDILVSNFTLIFKTEIDLYSSSQVLETKS